MTARPAVKLASAGRPRGSAAEGIMKRLASTPAVCPTWASPPLPSALLLVMNWRRLPWPASLVFTTVSKLKPKSRPPIGAVPTPTAVTDCSTAASPSVPPVVFAGPSGADGMAPPTSPVTAAGVPVEASVRNVWTGEQRRRAAGARGGDRAVDHAHGVTGVVRHREGVGAAPGGGGRLQEVPGRVVQLDRHAVPADPAAGRQGPPGPAAVVDVLEHRAAQRHRRRDGRRCR